MKRLAVGPIDSDASIEEDKIFLSVRHVQTWWTDDKEDQFLIQLIVAFLFMFCSCGYLNVKKRQFNVVC
jgi:hypothetical protein